MFFSFFLDKFISNLIVFVSYTLIIIFWSLFFYNFGNDKNLLSFYLPFGIIVLSFLFFGNKVIFGMLLTHISLYYFLKSYKLDLPFDNFFAISACQLICVPLILFVLQTFNITVGTGKNYKFDKTNIYHVFLITFFSTIVLGILFVFSSLFFFNQTNLLTFTAGNFFGGVVLIITMKLIVNLKPILKFLVKIN